MKKLLSILLFLLFVTSYGYGQTVVKMLLPQNCEANTTEVEKNIIDISNKLEVYPNPSSGNFSLYAHFSEDIKKATIQVYNTLGALVYSEEIYSNSPKLVKKIYLPHLLSGNYIIKFRTDTREITTKLLIN